MMPPKPDRILPHTEPCADDYDPTLVEAYNEALIDSLARMLAEPGARDLSNEQLGYIFKTHTGEYFPPDLFRGGDFILVGLHMHRLNCFTTKWDRSERRIFVMDWLGNRWYIDTIYGAGHGSSLQAQWAGDRWLAMINNNGENLCQECYNLWHITQSSEDWSATSLLEIRQTTGSPPITQLNGYRRIVLDVRYQHVPHPCTFKPLIAPDVYMVWKTARQEYWWSPAGYQLVDEEDASFHVVIRMLDNVGLYTTYRLLPDWPKACLPSSNNT